MPLGGHFFISGNELKQFQLLNSFGVVDHFFSPENLHHSKLFIGNTHNADMTFGRKDSFYSLYMHIGILTAGAVAQVNAELEHIEPVGHYFLTEPGIYFPVLFSFSWQVKKYKYPHDAVCIESFEHIPFMSPSGSCY